MCLQEELEGSPTKGGKKKRRRRLIRESRRKEKEGNKLSINLS